MCQQIPPSLEEVIDYHRDLLPVFNDMVACFKRLDALEIRRIVGDRLMDNLEDRFYRVAFKSFQETSNPYTNESHQL